MEWTLAVRTRSHPVVKIHLISRGISLSVYKLGIILIDEVRQLCREQI